MMASSSTMADAPPIDVSQPRYDLSTYSGRLRHFTEVTSPLTLLYSSQQLKDAQQLLVDYKAGKRKDLYDKPEEVYKAKQRVCIRSPPLVYDDEAKTEVTDSGIHPDTGEPVLLPFRMSAFVVTNLLVVGFMLTPNMSTTGIVASQWLNQSLNCGVNYANANKASPMSTTELATAYVSATATSVVLAVGLNSSVGRLKGISASAQALAKRFVPFVAVVAAGAVNVSMMRYRELTEGIPVRPPSRPDEPKKASLGDSKAAGRLAIGQTVASRVLVNIPTLVLPPLALTLLQRRGYFRGPHGKRYETLANLGLIGGALLLALPPAIAVFPQEGSVDPNKLEPRFHNAKDPATGEPLSLVQFNKGL